MFLENGNDSVLVRFRAILIAKAGSLRYDDFMKAGLLPDNYRIVNNYNNAVLDIFGFRKSSDDSIFSGAVKAKNSWGITILEVLNMETSPLLKPANEILFQKDCIHAIVIGDSAFQCMYDLRLITSTEDCADTIEMPFILN